MAKPNSPPDPAPATVGSPALDRPPARRADHCSRPQPEPPKSNAEDELLHKSTRSPTDAGAHAGERQTKPEEQNPRRPTDTVAMPAGEGTLDPLSRRNRGTPDLLDHRTSRRHSPRAPRCRGHHHRDGVGAPGRLFPANSTTAIQAPPPENITLPLSTHL